MMKVVSATALLAAAGAANAAFFEVRSVDTNSLGSPIVTSSALFQSTAPGAGNFGPSEATIDASSANQNAAFDSYVAIDVGPSFGGTNAKGDGFGANPGDISSIGNPFGVANQIGAVWYMDPQGARPEVGSVPNSLFGGADALFVGRFSFRSTTTTPTGTLSLGANGVVVDIRDPGTVGVGSPATDSLLVRFSAIGAPVQSGLDGGSLTTHPTANAYQLVEVVSTAGPLSGGTARWEIHDLYVVQVPTPGALALFGAAGLAAARRRRA